MSPNTKQSIDLVTRLGHQIEKAERRGEVQAREKRIKAFEEKYISKPLFGLYMCYRKREGHLRAVSDSYPNILRYLIEVEFSFRPFPEEKVRMQAAVKKVKRSVPRINQPVGLYCDLNGFCSEPFYVALITVPEVLESLRCREQAYDRFMREMAESEERHPWDAICC